MLFKSLARAQIDGGRTWFNLSGPQHLSRGISFPLATEQLDVLIHPVFRAFDRTADPGYGHCEMEKHPQASERLNWGDADFSGTKERCEAGRSSRLYGDSERSNCSATDSEQGKFLLANCWTFVCKSGVRVQMKVF
jgi:hypothetical protein